MKYGPAYGIVDLKTQPFIDRFESILGIISSSELEFKQSKVFKPNKIQEEDLSQRKSNVAFIEDENLDRILFSLVQEANYNARWNLNLHSVYPVQYGVYENNDFFGWHCDQNIEFDPNVDTSVKKISLTLFLNDPSEYEGGEFDIEYKGPASDPRYDTFKSPLGYVVFFQSHLWHRVRPVTSGIRKSIVAWFGGPPYT